MSCLTTLIILDPNQIQNLNIIISLFCRGENCRKKTYPVLPIKACDILIPPVSNVASKCTFSTIGFSISARDVRLLKDWLVANRNQNQFGLATKTNKWISRWWKKTFDKANKHYCQQAQYIFSIFLFIYQPLRI